MLLQSFNRITAIQQELQCLPILNVKFDIKYTNNFAQGQSFAHWRQMVERGRSSDSHFRPGVPILSPLICVGFYYQ